MTSSGFNLRMSSREEMYEVFPNRRAATKEQICKGEKTQRFVTQASRLCVRCEILRTVHTFDAVKL